jgi:hypothetical protein
MTKIVIFGDPDCTADTVKILDAIFKNDSNADLFVNEGDNGYDGKYEKSIALLEKYFPANSPQRKKLRLVLGNHDAEESEPEATEAAYGKLLPEQYKTQPEFAGTDQSWEDTRWLYGEQVGDIYNMIMNSQDMDIPFKKNQYSWVTKQLGIAATLKKSGKIKWVLNHVHKPWFTLKSSHSPYTNHRELYTDMFENLVNQNWHGHNHNDQCWRSMIAIKQEGNSTGKIIESLLTDGKTIDHSKPHGWTTNINGHSGHEHNKFKETATANENVLWSNDSVFTYAVVESKGNILNTKWKDAAGKVLFEYNISNTSMSSVPTPPPKPQPQPSPDSNAPTVPPPGPGFRWDTKQKKWIPKLEDPTFVNAATTTPPPKPPQPQPTTTPPPTTTGETVLWDSNVHLKTGKGYKITDTYGSQEPNGKGVFMAASGSPRVLVNPDGQFFLEADAGHGRMYIKATNYNARMEGEIMFVDEAIRNSTWRLRSRHNEGGGEGNNFGGFGATCEREEQLAEYATEPYHNVHENDIKKPLAKPIELNKWLKFKYSVQDSPDGKEVLFNTQYDYGDGKGWVTVLTGKHPNPKPYYMDKALYEKESYAWLRINNESTGKVAYRNVRIIGL